MKEGIEEAKASSSFYGKRLREIVSAEK